MSGGSYMRRRSVQQASADWTPRIGHVASQLLAEAKMIRRRSYLVLWSWLPLCITFQILNYRLGIIASCVLWVPGLYLTILGVRRLEQARSAAGRYLGLNKSASRRVMLRDTSTFDRWIGSRGQPGWPDRFARA